MALTFLKEFLKYPLKVGSIVPSSGALADAIVRYAGVADASTIIELGPGTGSFTQKILEGKKRSATFSSIELNPEFILFLKERFPSVDIHEDLAENLGRYTRSADCIVSGLPFVTIPDHVRERTLDAISTVLDDGGTFVTFTYAHTLLHPKSTALRKSLERKFSSVERSKAVLRNIPPAVVYICKK